jgi:hypothetical protein
MEGYPGSSMPHSSTLTDSSVSSDTCFRPEAEFLDEIQIFKLTQPLTVSVKEKVGKPDRKPYPLPYCLRNPYKPYLLPYCLKNPYRNLKSENSQDNAQKPQRDCMFMNSASAWLFFIQNHAMSYVTQGRHGLVL